MAKSMLDRSPDFAKPADGSREATRARDVRLAFSGGKTWWIRGWRTILCLLPAVIAAGELDAQVRPDSRAAPERKAPALRQAISLTAGYSWPLSREGITEFWQPGPTASIGFSVAVNRSVSLGLGLDLARFRFSESRFASANPGIAPQKDDVFWTSVSVGGRFAFLPGMRTNPYLSGSVGASRLTEALYRVVVDGTRTTYYHVGGSTRLTAFLGAGADIFFNRSLALEVEIRGAYIHNDPDFGLALSGQGGLRFAF
jgi:hypothetical protein